MNYNLSRLPGTYECDRELFGFNVNSKIYTKREYERFLDNFAIINTKHKDKFIKALISVNKEFLITKAYYKCVDIINDTALYSERTINLYEHNQKFISLMTKLVVRKLLIEYLNKNANTEIVEELTDEKKFITTVMIKDYTVFKDLHNYFYDILVSNVCSYEDFLNKYISKISKSNYLMSNTDKYTIDPKHPIEFSNIADGFDCAEVCNKYLNLLDRIGQICQQIEWKEQEKNKKFKAMVILTL